jgi:hypothetical protein
MSVIVVWLFQSIGSLQVECATTLSKIAIVVVGLPSEGVSKVESLFVCQSIHINYAIALSE